MYSERPFHRFITQPSLAPGLRTITRQEAVQNMTSKYTHNNDDNNNNINNNDNDNNDESNNRLYFPESYTSKKFCENNVL